MASPESPTRICGTSSTTSAASARNPGKKIPLLGKGGVAAPSIKCREASFEGADGVVGSTSEQICDEVDRTTPCPSFAKEGNSHPGVTCVQSSGHRPRPQSS